MASGVDLVARISQLESQLEEKDAAVNKLKGVMARAKEISLNTRKVVQQKLEVEKKLQHAGQEAAEAIHRLQAAQESLSQADTARGQLRAQLEAAHSERDEAKQEAESLRKLVSALSLRLDVAERAASDAKNMATKAMEMHGRITYTVNSLDQHLQSTRQRVKDQEDKSKSLHANLQAVKDAVTKQSGQLREASTCIDELRSRQGEGAHDGAQLAALQQQVGGLAAQVARMEQGSPPSLDPLSDPQGLHPVVAALQARLGSVEAVVARFSTAMNAFAAAATAPLGRLTSPTGGEGSNQLAGGPATAGLGSGVVLRAPPQAAARERVGSWGGEPQRNAPRSEESLSGAGAGRQGRIPQHPRSRLAHQAAERGPVDPGGVARQPVRAGDGSGLRRPEKRARLEEGDSTGAPDPPHHPTAPNVRRVLPIGLNGGRGGAPAAAAAAAPATIPCPVTPTAVELVEGLIGRIRQGSEPLTPDIISQVACGLQKAVATSQCPLETIVTGFESALLSCALFNAGPSPAISSSFDASSVSEPTHVSPDAPLEDQPYTAAWCSKQDHSRHTVTSLLQCAAAVDTDPGSGCVGLLEALRTRLHMLAVCAHPEGHVPLNDSEAAVLCAALATICRLQGRLEALRVMVVDLLLAWGPSPRSLPRLAAALLAWPAALQYSPDLTANPLQRCVTAALRDMCASAEAPIAPRAIGLSVNNGNAGAVHGAVPAAVPSSVSVAARALHQVGMQCWNWPAVLEPSPNPSSDSSILRVGDRFPHMQAEVPSLLRNLEGLLEVSGPGGEPDSEPDRSRWESVAISLEVATLFLGFAWAYEQVLAARLLAGFGKNAKDGLRLRERASSMAARVASCMLRSGDDPPVVRAAVTAVCSHLLRVWQASGEPSPQTPSVAQDESLTRQAAPSALVLIRRLQREVEGNA